MAISDWVHHNEPLKPHYGDSGYVSPAEDDPDSEDEDGFMNNQNFFVTCELLLCFFLPPVAVWLERGLRFDLLVNCILTCAGYVPGIVHAFWLITKYESRYTTWRAVRLGQLAKSGTKEVKRPHTDSESSTEDDESDGGSDLEKAKLTGSSGPKSDKKRSFGSRLRVAFKPARDWAPPKKGRTYAPEGPIEHVGIGHPFENKRVENREVALGAQDRQLAQAQAQVGSGAGAVSAAAMLRAKMPARERTKSGLQPLADAPGVVAASGAIQQLSDEEIGGGGSLTAGVVSAARVGKKRRGGRSWVK